MPNEVNREIRRLRGWVRDLQSGLYVNCVYCGHRYGPGETTPASMADALKAHVEQCSEHPMSALKRRAEAAEQRVRELEQGLVDERAENQRLLVQRYIPGTPHSGPEDCPTYYDGCNCDVATLEHNMKRAEVAEQRVRELEDGSLVNTRMVWLEGRVHELEAHITALASALTLAREQLIWCSGSADFNEGGIAREGWLKGAAPAIDAAEAALAALAACEE